MERLLDKMVAKSPMLPPAISEISRLLPLLHTMNAETMQHHTDGGDLGDPEAADKKTAFMRDSVNMFEQITMAVVMAKSILDGIKKAEKQKAKKGSGGQS